MEKEHRPAVDLGTQGKHGYTFPGLLFLLCILDLASKKGAILKRQQAQTKKPHGNESLEIQKTFRQEFFTLVKHHSKNGGPIHTHKIKGRMESVDFCMKLLRDTPILL